MGNLNYTKLIFINIFMVLSFNIFSFENNNCLFLISSKNNFYFNLENNINNNICLIKEKKYNALKISSFFAASSFILALSFGFGNLALINRYNTGISSVFGFTSLSLFISSFLMYNLSQSLIFMSLFEYFFNNPEEYLKRYFKVRNILIASLCINCTLSLASFIVSAVFAWRIHFMQNVNDYEYYIAANFAYGGSVLFLGSVLISSIIILKHFLYKNYYKNKKTAVKENKFLPVIDLANDKFILGASYLF